ncbi:MAG TPA: hypothetical protein VLC30_16890, partial [Pseudomonas sp.]|nr:hypothetical protein [Pseudomonas sp.]
KMSHHYSTATTGHSMANLRLNLAHAFIAKAYSPFHLRTCLRSFELEPDKQKTAEEAQFTSCK